MAKDESDTQSRSNQGLHLLPGDLLLLCTDGLTDVVENADIEPTVRGLDLQSAAQALVDLACARDGQDNLTVVMMLVPWQDLPGGQDLENPEKKKSKFWLWALWGTVGLVVLALVLASLAWVLMHFILPPVPAPIPIP